MGTRQTVAITGASGFIGRAVVAALANAGFEVRAISRKEKAGPLPERGVWHQIPTYDDRGALAVALGNASTVIHLADNPARTGERNTSNGVELLRALVDSMDKVGADRLILVSSIYARTSLNMQDYGQSKVAIETALAGMPLANRIVLRLPPIYGPGGKGGFATLSKLVSKGVPLPFGAAQAPRDYLSRANLADLIVAIAAADNAAWTKADGQKFEPSDGKPISTADLILALADAHGRRARLFFMNVQLLKLAALIIGKREIVASAVEPLETLGNSALTQIFGWEPQEQMPQSLAFLAQQ